jgi:hypothetical protein
VNVKPDFTVLVQDFMPRYDAFKNWLAGTRVGRKLAPVVTHPFVVIYGQGWMLISIILAALEVSFMLSAAWWNAIRGQVSSMLVLILTVPVVLIWWYILYLGRRWLRNRIGLSHIPALLLLVYHWSTLTVPLALEGYPMGNLFLAVGILNNGPQSAQVVQEGSTTTTVPTDAIPSIPTTPPGTTVVHPTTVGSPQAMRATPSIAPTRTATPRTAPSASPTAAVTATARPTLTPIPGDILENRPGMLRIIGTGKILAAEGLNLRAGPGTKFDVLRKIVKNATVHLYGYDRTGGWAFVSYDNDDDGIGIEEGWISADTALATFMEYDTTAAP